MPLYLAACLGVATFFAVSVGIAEEPKKDEPTAAAPSAAPAAAVEPPKDAAAAAAMTATAVTNKSPLDVVAANPLGSMKNPYTDDPAHIEEGRKLYFSYSCNGCHGGGGGGGMCPPLTNDTWVYGSGDDILFRLITLGSQDLQKTYSIKRKGQEGVVGPMPPFGSLIKSDDELWKIIAFVHTLYKGNRRTW
jgi:mono/diheme cytochrome c family protein